MAATLVRTGSGSGTTVPDNYSSRNTIVLSDGNRLVAVYGFETAQWYIYYTTDGITYTLKITLPAGYYNVFSMAVEDTGDHIQVAYMGTDPTTLVWARYTKSGTTWTLAGSVETISSGSVVTGSIDLDCLTGAGACIAVYRTSNGGGGGALAARARGTGGTWGTEVVLDSQSGAGSAMDPVTVSANNGGAVSGTQNVLIGGIIWAVSNPFKTANVNVATGAISSVVSVSSATFGVLGTPGGYSEYPPNHILFQTFRSTATQYYLVVCVPVTTTQVGITLYRVTLSGGVWTASQIATTTQPHRQTSSGKPAAVILNTGKLAVFLNNASGELVDCCTIDVANGSVIGAFNFTSKTATTHIFNYVGAGAQRFVQGIADVSLADALDRLSFSDYNHAVPAPTAVTPLAGSNVATDAPTLSATLPDLQQPGSFKRKAKWQLATNSGFTTGVVNITEGDGDMDAATIHYESQGAIITEGVTWWIRAATLDPFGVASVWTAGQSFTNVHSPSAINLTPTNGQAFAYTTGQVVFDWDFTDPFPDDTQLAYQIVVENNSTGAAVLDTGKVTSALSTATLTIPVGGKNVVLRWKIRLWNQSDAVGAYSSYATFLIGDVPTVSVTAPTEAAVLANGSPAVAWTFTGSGGRTQASYRIVFTQTTAPAHVIHDSGFLSGATTSYTPPTDILENLKNYTVTVYVTDTVGFPGQDSNTFSTLWVPPDPITSQGVDPTPYNTQGFVAVTWDNTDQDPDWVDYRVYRKPVAEDEWTLAHTTDTVLASYEYHDWLVGGEAPQEYAVVQSASKFSSSIESDKIPTDSVVVSNADYWLVDPEDDSKNILLANVTEDSFSDEYESADLQLIGRGRKRDFGTRWGYSGSLTAQVWDDEINNITARDARKALEAMKAEMKTVYLRTPFGDVWQVALGDAQIGRLAGVGTREFHTLTLPYLEVS